MLAEGFNQKLYLSNGVSEISPSNVIELGKPLKSRPQLGIVGFAQKSLVPEAGLEPARYR